MGNVSEFGMSLVIIGTLMAAAGALSFILGWRGNIDFLIFAGGVLGAFGFAIIVMGFYTIVRGVLDSFKKLKAEVEKLALKLSG